MNRPHLFDYPFEAINAGKYSNLPIMSKGSLEMSSANLEKYRSSELVDDKTFGYFKYHLIEYSSLKEYLKIINSSAKITHFVTKDRIDLLDFTDQLKHHHSILKETEVIRLNMQRNINSVGDYADFFGLLKDYLFAPKLKYFKVACYGIGRLQGQLHAL